MTARYPDACRDRTTAQYCTEIALLHHSVDTGEDFLWLVLKHVLPRRLRRSRDYGFLHSNAKKQLSLVQLVLNVMVKAVEPVVRPKFTCRRCGESMKHIAFGFLKPT
ncbi:transposase [Endozoicomonas sp. 8E]|uniref:transposase n=1 Tax=Endozoicomonas sp. 8E TaxID=3035692 RepID=UPI0039774F14